MYNEFVDYLVCPVCSKNMNISVYVSDSGRIKEGVLSCIHCNKKFAIVDFIPRMVPTYLFPVKEFCQTYGLDEADFLKKWDDDDANIVDIQTHTQNNFGHEWEYYSKLGWNEEVGVDASHRDESQKWFHEKSLLSKDDVSGKLVLDAGCGNGRFTRAAISAGANVISMDLTKAADVAYTNLCEMGMTAQVIQGDILHAPFKKDLFEIVFTIGVVQHTGEPLRAVSILGSLVKPNGLLSVRTYQLANKRLEENDVAIRSETVKLSLDDLHELSDILSKLTHFLLKKKLYGKVAKHINLFPKRYDIFDWYSAPVAAKMTYEELKKTFNSIGLDVYKDADDGSLPEQRSFSAISIVGKKRGC